MAGPSFRCKDIVVLFILTFHSLKSWKLNQRSLYYCTLCLFIMILLSLRNMLKIIVVLSKTEIYLLDFDKLKFEMNLDDFDNVFHI